MLKRSYLKYLPLVIAAAGIATLIGTRSFADSHTMMDYAIGKLLHLRPHQTHLLTSGMDFGRKLRLLLHGYKRGRHKRKNVIIGCLNYFWSEKRNIFAHSFMITSP